MRVHLHFTALFHHFSTSLFGIHTTSMKLLHSSVSIILLVESIRCIRYQVDSINLKTFRHHSPMCDCTIKCTWRTKIDSNDWRTFGGKEIDEDEVKLIYLLQFVTNELLTVVSVFSRQWVSWLDGQKSVIWIIWIKCLLIRSANGILTLRLTPWHFQHWLRV